MKFYILFLQKKGFYLSKFEFDVIVDFLVIFLKKNLKSVREPYGEDDCT